MKRLMALLLALTLLAGYTQSSGGSGQEQGSETARDSIVSAFSADVGTFDPYVMTDTGARARPQSV